MNFSLHGPGLWYATRAAGLVSLLLLTVSMLLGILTAGRFTSEKWPAFLSQGLHRNISLLAVLFLALVGTSLVRARLGHRAWRRLHWLAYACWPVAVAHGLGIGTDRSATWVIALSMVCVSSVLGVATWRIVTAARLGVR